MKQYFEVVVEYRTEDENGKTKKSKETILVDSISVTESEAKLIGHLRKQGETREFTVLSSKESKIKEII
jgi:hypothetical protein